MKIDSTTFGTITIDGKTYEHDVVVRLSGEVVKHGATQWYTLPARRPRRPGRRPLGESPAAPAVPATATSPIKSAKKRRR